MDELVISSFTYALGHSNFVVKRSLNFIQRVCLFNQLKEDTLKLMLDTTKTKLQEYEEAILEAEMEKCFGNENFVSKKLNELGGTEIALEWSKFKNFLITKVRH